MIVDSPGYGRTKAPLKLKKKFATMITKYLCYGVRLNMILLCVRAKHGISGDDI